MKQLKPVGEGSSFSYTFSLYDSTDTAITPTSMEYRIDCLTSKQTVRGWTTITPDVSMTVNVAPEDNGIIRDSNPYEMKQMTFRANDGLGTQWVDAEPVVWRVNNMITGRSITP